MKLRNVLIITLLTMLLDIGGAILTHHTPVGYPQSWNMLLYCALSALTMITAVVIMMYALEHPIDHIEETKKEAPVEKKKSFPLINVVKYSKNHYEHSGNLWYDMALCLEADDYGPFTGYTDEEAKEPVRQAQRNRRDIASIILGKTLEWLTVWHPHRIEELFVNIDPVNSWRCGYYTKSSWIRQRDESLPEWEYDTALVRVCLSELAYTSAPELGYDNWDKFVGDNVPKLTKNKEEEPCN